MTRDTLERLIDEDTALRTVVEGTASSTGEDFYRALVENLSKALDTRGAWVTVYDEARARLRALAFHFAGKWVDNFEYSIVGTACETAVREKRLVHIPDRVLDLYPGDKDPLLAGVVSYLGVPILDESKTVLGHLAVVDNRPMPDEKRLLTLFKIFAERASAEMKRIRLESALREREEKLRRLIEGAMDAIIEFDEGLCVTMMNPASEKLFGCPASQLRGEHMERLLGVDAARHVDQIAREIGKSIHGERHIWIPEPLLAKPCGGASFWAEATLSGYEALGHTFFTVILRNVEDRVRAERRIASLSAQAEYLRAEIEEVRGFDEIVGESPVLLTTLQSVSQVAQTDASVLILGETGTGKELFARAIHKRSQRRQGPMIKVNCAAIPASLIESEFFGHERGAFTGATQRRDGRFALADGGTIFLDEIGELPLELQGKLLRILQEGEFELVGGTRTHRVDVRVIAATNRDLEREVREGTFREDLYYRLSVFPLQLPPLRERGDDVLLIARNIIESLSRRMGRRVESLSPSAAAALKSYHWPGNVRELRNVIERALITSGNAPLRFDHLMPTPQAAPLDVGPVVAPSSVPEIMDEQRLRQIERENMIAALEQKAWRVGGENGAARLIGISPSTFKSRMKALSIKRPV